MLARPLFRCCDTLVLGPLQMLRFIGPSVCARRPWVRADTAGSCRPYRPSARCSTTLILRFPQILVSSDLRHVSGADGLGPGRWSWHPLPAFHWGDIIPASIPPGPVKTGILLDK